MNVDLRLSRALAAALLAASLAACTDPPADEPTSTDPTCPGEQATIVNRRGADFRFEQVTESGPLLDRSVKVAYHPRAGHVCVDIVIGHADPGSDPVAYTLTATRSGTTWHQEGADPEEAEPLRVEARGCVAFVGSLTVVDADDEEFEYRAEGRAGLGCPT